MRKKLNKKIREHIGFVITKSKPSSEDGKQAARRRLGVFEKEFVHKWDRHPCAKKWRNFDEFLDIYYKSSNWKRPKEDSDDETEYKADDKEFKSMSKKASSSCEIVTPIVLTKSKRKKSQNEFAPVDTIDSTVDQKLLSPLTNDSNIYYHQRPQSRHRLFPFSLRSTKYVVHDSMKRSLLMKEILEHKEYAEERAKIIKDVKVSFINFVRNLHST
jgi:hypothetical protein